MLNRWIGIACFGLMLSANTALFMRDHLPALTAGDAPTPEVFRLGTGEERWVQTAIRDSEGREVGKSWTRVHRDQAVSTHEQTTFINAIRLPGGVLTPAVRVEMELLYQADAHTVDEAHLRVAGLPVTVKFDGERISGEFACMWKVGDQTGTFVLDGAATRALGDALRPFDRLPNLDVGQTWRMRLVNPLENLAPGLRAEGIDLESVLVRVTAREQIRVDGTSFDAFRVEAPRAVAWVAEDGRVVLQEVDLPLLGKLTIVDQPFDAHALREYKRQFQSVMGPDEIFPADSHPSEAADR